MGEAGHAVFPHAVYGGVKTGDETAARGVAYRRGRVALCEHDAFGREAICMGGMGKGTAHAVEGVPALGVCCDEQEVGVFGHVCSSGS